MTKIGLCLFAANIGTFFGGWFYDQTITLSQHLNVFKRTKMIIHPLLCKQDLALFGLINLSVIYFRAKNVHMSFSRICSLGAIFLFWFDINRRTDTIGWSSNYRDGTKKCIAILQLIDNLITILFKVKSLHELNPTTTKFFNNNQTIDKQFKKEVKKLYQTIQPEDLTNPFYLRNLVTVYENFDAFFANRSNFIMRFCFKSLIPNEIRNIIAQYVNINDVIIVNFQQIQNNLLSCRMYFVKTK